MGNYRLRFNYFYEHQNYQKLIKGKVVIKTQEIGWQNSKEPAILLTSVPSRFHEGDTGRMKLEGLIETLRDELGERLTLLIADQAHTHVRSIHESDSALQARLDGERFLWNFSELLQGIRIEYWGNLIQSNPQYRNCQREVVMRINASPHLQALLLSDAELTYTPERKQKYLDRDLFVQMTMKDLVEQATALTVLSSLGYRYQFYPGAQCPFIEAISEKLPLANIKAFVAIERKKEEHYPQPVEKVEKNGSTTHPLFV